MFNLLLHGLVISLYSTSMALKSSSFRKVFELRFPFGSGYLLSLSLSLSEDILWLAGAPGSGKGAMTRFIMQELGTFVPPIETRYLLHSPCVFLDFFSFYSTRLRLSALLLSPEALALKASGLLVSDRTVVKLILEQLLLPKYKDGCIVDGFPRTPIQV